jgi:thiosulfate/3-mercaptopyruvate sulfurtransferase
MYTTLISADQLQKTLGTVTVVDCRADLLRPDVARDAYLAGHIPAAIYAHLENDLSGPKTPYNGRHPLPDPNDLAATFGRWGISQDSQVVAYDADTGMFASRLWWLLRWLGHRAVAVLDGGLKNWIHVGLPLAVDVSQPKASLFTPSIDRSAVVDTDEVAALITQKEWRVLDARAPERFRGEVEPIDPVAGHIPGARNHPFATNIGANGRLLAADQLTAIFRSSLDGVSADKSIMMCGSGVTACHNLLAMEVAGMTGAKLYAGSWSEWIRDPSRPVEKKANSG